MCCLPSLVLVVGPVFLQERLTGQLPFPLSTRAVHLPQRIQPFQVSFFNRQQRIGLSGLSINTLRTSIESRTTRFFHHVRYYHICFRLCERFPLDFGARACIGSSSSLFHPDTPTASCDESRLANTPQVLANALYNVYLHPLRHVPGPFWARASDIPSWYYTARGKRHILLWQLIQIYGKRIRVAPNLVIFCDPEAHAAIYGMKSNVRRSTFYVGLTKNIREKQL